MCWSTHEALGPAGPSFGVFGPHVVVTEVGLAARSQKTKRMDGWVDGALPFDAFEGEAFNVAEVLLHDGNLHTDRDVADDLAYGRFRGRIGCHEMRGGEVGGRSRDGDGCLGGARSGGSVVMLGDRGRFIWRRGWFVDWRKGGACALGLGSSRGVRVLGFGGACALRRALGRVIGISVLTLPLWLRIMGGVAIDLFGIQDRDGSRGSDCMIYAVCVLKVC